MKSKNPYKFSKTADGTEIVTYRGKMYEMRVTEKLGADGIIETRVDYIPYIPGKKKFIFFGKRT